MHVGLSLLAIEHDDLDTADRHLRASAELGEHMGLPQQPYRWRVAAARRHQADGDLITTLDLLTEAAARYNTDYSPNVRPVTVRQSRSSSGRNSRSTTAMPPAAWKSSM